MDDTRAVPRLHAVAPEVDATRCRRRRYLVLEHVPPMSDPGAQRAGARHGRTWGMGMGHMVAVACCAC